MGAIEGLERCRWPTAVACERGQQRRGQARRPATAPQPRWGIFKEKEGMRETRQQQAGWVASNRGAMHYC